MFSKVSLIINKVVDSRLRDRFGSEIAELERKGFTEVGALEVRHYFPLVPSALLFGVFGQEVLRWEFPFCVNWYHPVMQSPDGATIAYPFGLGLRYYTFFEDGWAHRTSACQDKDTTHQLNRCKLFVANLREKAVVPSLQRHLGFVEQYKRHGKTLSQSRCMDQLVELQTAEDSLIELLLGAFIGWGAIAGGVIWVYEAVGGQIS